MKTRGIIHCNVWGATVLMRRAHVVFGAAIGSLAAWLLGLCPIDSRAIWLLGWSLAASTLPDIDLRRRHRAAAHNLFFTAAVVAAAWLLVDRLLDPVLAVYAATGTAAGLLSHLLADSLTLRGVALLYPLSGRRYRLARLRSSSTLANAMVVLVSALIIAAYAYCCSLLPGCGYLGRLGAG